MTLLYERKEHEEAALLMFQGNLMPGKWEKGIGGWDTMHGRHKIVLRSFSLWRFPMHTCTA